MSRGAAGVAACKPGGMPEGDAVRRTARRLDAALAGQALRRADLRVPQHATDDLSGFTVAGTAVVGKHLLTRLEREDERLTLHSHLRMDGRWVTGAAGSRPCAGPAHQVRVWLNGESAQAVGVRLMEVRLVATSAEHTLVGHLGPDILGERWDAEAVAVRVAGEGIRPLVETVLDQTVISGIGTMWAAELAFQARVGPYRPVQDVPDLAPALERIRQRMRRAVIDDPRASRARLNVFERAGRPCLRCGTSVRSGRVGKPPLDRITYWCPTCQSSG